MRRLLLLRHAKAERSQSGGRDQDRILTKRGRNDATAVGKYLARHGLVPDRTLVSTSARTRETWAHLAEALGNMLEADFDDRLYDASPETILNVVRETDPEAKTLLVIGHNPGLQQLAATLTASGDIDARQRLLEHFPTSALAAVNFANKDWENVHPHGGRLEHFVTPGSLVTASD